MWQDQSSGRLQDVHAIQKVLPKVYLVRPCGMFTTCRQRLCIPTGTTTHRQVFIFGVLVDHSNCGSKDVGPVVLPHNTGVRLMAKDTWRVVTRGADGELYIHDFDSPEHIIRSHLRIGSDDCSTDLDLRGAPIFRSLIGPMPEGSNIVRYETPEVFEALTKEWSMPRAPRRRVRKTEATAKI